MPSPLRLAALAILLPGCLTLRASVGPRTTVDGARGGTATGGFGMGWTLPGHRAVYAVVNGGVDGGDHARALLFDSFSYVDHDAPLPLRVDLRLGSRFGRTRFGEGDQVIVGAAVALLPWHATTEDHGGRSEKGWTDIGPDLIGVRGLGVELAVDTLLPTEPADRQEVMIGLNLVAEMGTMIDH